MSLDSRVALELLLKVFQLDSAADRETVVALVKSRLQQIKE